MCVLHSKAAFHCVPWAVPGIEADRQTKGYPCFVLAKATCTS